ncbi:type III-B CRISPR module RAMP protein Cmr1 [Vibrio spartinae]|uniref:CRISPR type III-associated protein domain-containing protein n=1 Tax=Vibrio spartinae TaxID=1918945 RepID=A0A1N6MAY4_9VIBR|nr:type III-B CRISPR module RAMP protein Cmr1 [Vibrio spartinae]SIO96526.1 hypothetical protein VSP9026_04329 [Vibrio spartinae]
MRRKTEDKFGSLQNALDAPPRKAWQTYQCELVTPMYGGGVEAGKVDEKMPIRASAIRGHLRFWWRIACGPFNSPKEMFDRETAIWGGIGDDKAKSEQKESSEPEKYGSTKSKVQILVSNVVFKGEEKAFEYEKKTDGKYKQVPASETGYAYVLFALQGKLRKGATELVEEAKNIAKSGLTFDLNIHFKTQGKRALTPEQVGEVHEAIRWWASFGGVGSRTRRGLGAVKVIGEGITPVTRDEVEAKGGVLTLVSRNGKPETDAHAVACWRYGCDKLRDFRQGKKIGRNEGSSDPKRPGQSRWPEPDQLRRFTQDWKFKHDPKHEAGNVFPRAAFGMPIIFDFNDKTRKEPDTMVLQPIDSERMTSPLILRPYRDGDHWRAAALLLPNWKEVLAQPLELMRPSEHKKLDYQPNHWPILPEEQNKLAQRIEPMCGRANDPLSAFLDYFKEGN